MSTYCIKLAPKRRIQESKEVECLEPRGKITMSAGGGTKMRVRNLSKGGEDELSVKEILADINKRLQVMPTKDDLQKMD